RPRRRGGAARDGVDQRAAGDGLHRYGESRDQWHDRGTDRHSGPWRSSALGAGRVLALAQHRHQRASVNTLMSPFRFVACAAIVFATALTLHAVVPQGQTAPPQTPPPVAQPPGGRGAAPAPGAPGGRGGRGNPAASTYTEICSGCHGTDLAGGRAPTLFADKWNRGSDDESIVRNIQN